MKYSKDIDKKWQKKWKEENLYKYNPKEEKEKFYTMEMFSYPSGANLHLGHWFNFAPADSFARFKTMQGYNVFHPMGFDAFGLPAENYAIKTGIHPEDSTIKNIETMKRQLEEMGGTYDWDYSVETCMPNYYKWTQWIFTKLYENGLAYKKEAPVNWCSSCKTVLANEQVIDCKCERCGTVVERKKMSQWFFKITDYAEELLEGLKDLDWPESTKKIQTNWIGKSEGAEIKFEGENGNFEINVFTTRPDTLYGVTYVVVAPESKIVEQITTEKYKSTVENYIKETMKLNEIERLSTEREKTGVFTGSYVINPINNKKIPVWIADYVLEDYGTGSVMAVPAHDKRDYEFAKKYDLPIKQVVKPEADIKKVQEENVILKTENEGKMQNKSYPKIENEDKMQNKSYLKNEKCTDNKELPYTEYGILVNSEKYTGISSLEAKEKIVEDLSKTNKAKKAVNYKLKDWLISRQRYWGAPIPIIYCPKCGIVPVPEKDLPVLLPKDVEFRPDGESPLKKSQEFINCTCPKCGEKATREADTLDTFVCSSWYELRYPDAKNTEKAFDKQIVNKMLPVDVYVGGKEHAAMHLIYARFMVKALRDMGYLDFDEPFKRLVHQGMILGPDGNKMSKSKGNTVSPDKYVEKYGSDVFRMYLMFGFDYKKGGPWDDSGVEAMSKYFTRVEKLVETFVKEYSKESKNVADSKGSKELNFLDNLNNNVTEVTNYKVEEKEMELLRVKNKTIKSMSEDIEEFQFNTAIARIMELLNQINSYIKENENINIELLKETIETYLKLLAPLAPHFAEEQWEKLGNNTSIHKEKWPEVNKEEICGGNKEIPIQVNGKLKTTVLVDSKSTPEEILSLIKNSLKVQKILKDYIVQKEIYVPGRIYNVVANKKDKKN